MGVIEFAEHRMEEEERQRQLGADNEYCIRYWAHYLDGAREQKKESNKMIEELLDESECELMDGIGVTGFKRRFNAEEYETIKAVFTYIGEKMEGAGL